MKEQLTYIQLTTEDTSTGESSDIYRVIEIFRRNCSGRYVSPIHSAGISPYASLQTQDRVCFCYLQIKTNLLIRKIRGQGW